jgi:hypothetical protein
MQCFRATGSVLHICLLLCVLAVAGCATYGEGIDPALHHVKKKEYQKAQSKLEESLDPEGDDRLLYYLERGTIAHLNGNYTKSNEDFEKAHRLADRLRSEDTADKVASAMINPRQSEYMGNNVERVYINYYKTLNYILLSQKARNSKERREYLQAASVELRRLDNTLSAISFQKGDYEQAKKEEEETFAKLYDLFDKLRGNWRDERWLVFREDAFARYLSGIIYEKMGNLDDARISYQNAAELYEQGYVEQYNLAERMAERAWLDAIRMMRRLGGWEGQWPGLAKEKLSAGSRERLEKLERDMAQIVVVQHLGMVPQRDELNLLLTAQPQSRSLRLEPVPSGSPREMRDQLAWFFLLYGDKGLTDLLYAYSEDSLSEVSVTHKTIPLGPAWELARELRVIRTLGNTGIRVTVPYYPPPRRQVESSKVVVDDTTNQRLLTAESISQIAIQNQLLHADHDLRAALSRSLLKCVLASEAGNALAGGLGGLAGKVLASASSAAETRNWLCLPYEVRLARKFVHPGEHDLRLVTLGESGNCIAQAKKTVDLEAGEIYLWVQRSMDPAQIASSEN